VSNALALGAVTAVVRNLLDNGFIDSGAPLSPVKVTAIAPDLVKLDDPDAPPSLNLFLYRTTRNLGWAEVGLPSFDYDGTRLTNPPLALNLHYLLTAYGVADFQAEILLGYAMHLLHERPVLDRAAIRRALDPSPLGPTILPPAFQALTASDLADQLDAVTITDESLDNEELARVWTAIQTHYRPSTAYRVTVVLIEAHKPTREALPVLTRDVEVVPDLVPPYPTIETIETLKAPAARLGEKITISGHDLEGTSTVVRLMHHMLDGPHEITVGTSNDPAAIDVTLPSGPTAEAEWPAGVYTVTVELIRPTDTKPRESNVAALLLAPEPLLPPSTISRDAGTGDVTVTLGVRPEVRPGQEAQLVLGGDGALADPIATSSSTLTFHLGVVPSGPQWVRLTVDGVESLLVDRSADPPAFDSSQSVAVPA
jgi:Pvc16 N-terminal domain